MSEFAKLSSLGGGIVVNIIYGLAAILVMIGAFYGTRYFQKNSKKQKAFTIHADIVDMNGVIEHDMLAFQKAEGSGLLEMIFKIRKTDSVPPIPKHLIKSGRVGLLNYAPGHYAVIDFAKTIRNMERGINVPVLYNLGMKKYITSKHREMMNIGERKIKNWEIYAPWVVLGIGIVGALILAGVFFSVGGLIDSSNIAHRTQECIQMGWKP